MCHDLFLTSTHSFSLFAKSRGSSSYAQAKTPPHVLAMLFYSALFFFRLVVESRWLGMCLVASAQATARAAAACAAGVSAGGGSPLELEQAQAPGLEQGMVLGSEQDVVVSANGSRSVQWQKNSSPTMTSEDISTLYEKAFMSLSKGIFLLSQWKASWDSAIAAAVASGARDGQRCGFGGRGCLSGSGCGSIFGRTRRKHDQHDSSLAGCRIQGGKEERGSWGSILRVEHTIARVTMK